MAETTIEWTRGPSGEQGFTFNPWIGCTKVSPGCDHCYAARQDAHRRWTPEGWGGPRRRTKTWGDPVKWNAQAEREGRRYRVFCASLADVFDNQVPAEWRADLFALIERTPHLDWLLLTKRIGNVERMLHDICHGADEDLPLWDWLPNMPNVWLGATVVNQEEADRDIPKLLAVPARVRFLSIEPMLGPIDLTLDSLVCTPCRWCADASADPDTGAVEHCRRCEWTGKSDEWGIDWIIAGGESGPHARPAHPAWFRSLRDQCAAAGVPFLFKQWGEWREPLDGEPFDTSMGGAAKPPAFIVSKDNGTVHCFESRYIVDGLPVIRIGKKAAGRLLDGVTHDGFPEVR